MINLFDYIYNYALYIVLGTVIRIVFNVRAKFSLRRHVLELAFCIVTGAVVGFVIVDFTQDTSYGTLSALLCAFFGSHIWRGFERLFPSLIQTFKNKLEK